MALFTIEWVGNVSGADKYQTEILPEAASQTFKKGSPVAYDLSANGVQVVSTSSGEMNADPVYGFALEDASGTTNTAITVLVPQPGDLFSAMLASDQSTLVAPDTDNYGQLGGLILLSSSATDANGVAAAGTEWAVLEGGSGAQVAVIKVDPRDLASQSVDLPFTSSTTLAVGTRVIFRYLGSDDFSALQQS